ncbi:MAG: hypothetical protein H0Z38_03230 [Firmicutes bacterium]|nr:hypothetical protein [Bacillota bacterium]
MAKEQLITLIITMLGILVFSQLASATGLETLSNEQLGVVLGGRSPHTVKASTVSGHAFQNAKGISVIAQVTGDGNQISYPITFNIYFFNNVRIDGNIVIPDTGGLTFTLPLE